MAFKAEIRDLNGYRCIYMPEHPKAMKNDNWLGYVYEHIEVAERYLGRSLSEDEFVHHLDLNKQNNRNENLLVLHKTQHPKFHAWLNRCNPIVTKLDELSFCQGCGHTLQEKQEKFCSNDCRAPFRNKVERPDKEQLICDMKILPMVKIGIKYGVSDNAVRKWAKGYGLI